MGTNSGMKVNGYNFTQLFAKAWEKPMTPSNIVSGFRATGVCPFNRSAIKIPGVDNVSDEESPILKATRLAYVPFISSAHPRKPNNGEVENPFTDEEELPKKERGKRKKKGRKRKTKAGETGKKASEEQVVTEF